MAARNVTVCVLLYGDYKVLAMRCIESIRATEWAHRVNIVIGMNAVCEDTRQYVYGLYGNDPFATIFDSEKNLRKYPMMRHMFYDKDGGAIADKPKGSGDFIIWFDDDSYVLPDNTATGKDWLELLRKDLQTRGDMLGSKYTLDWQGAQKQWVRQQSWYNPKVDMNTKKLVFITGGWWVATIDMLRDCDYPWRSLQHNGGDSMFGEMCRHVGYKQAAYARGGIAVNANANGVSAQAPRRGISEPVIGKYNVAGGINSATTQLTLDGVISVVTADGVVIK